MLTNEQRTEILDRLESALEPMAEFCKLNEQNSQILLTADLAKLNRDQTRTLVRTAGRSLRSAADMVQGCHLMMEGLKALLTFDQSNQTVGEN